ncbi:MAG TPA: tRNA preQ1(34) S-adenosylmethionine ribosyltransferase-isomerase QueA [Kiritimatiellia bacterium]|nr:tRNA preQ1(34) S-adenosylmethionine ribosyltransferase-isomerase QueA [Kiritimatiellia bacterium]
MKTSDFDYDLPESLIAQQPATPRDTSRLMVIRRDTHAIEHHVFTDLPDILSPHDLLVMNNTKVIPARLLGKKESSGGKVELLLLEPLGENQWDVLLRAGSKRPQPGQRIHVGGGAITATLLSDGIHGRATVNLQAEGDLMDALIAHGSPPLPPYIHRHPGSASTDDEERYQTIYAREWGAVAAPTAGLHFTPRVFDRLAAKGIRRAELTLHTGIGTFRPVKAESILDHVMEEERYLLPQDTARSIAETRKQGGRVIAVGSTSVRTLETLTDEQGITHPGQGRSGLFIHPPYSFRAVDAMLTNFHLPKSTLLMMVSALAGRDLILRAYNIAVQENYRFFSYGDAMLIL